MKFSIKKGQSWLNSHYAKSVLVDSSLPIDVEFSNKYIPKRLSKSQARRMSRLSKMTVDLSLGLVSGEKVDQAIFASRHGELDNSTYLIDLIVENEILSPTKFTQSVQNTSSGLFSILSENKASSLSISAGENSFLMGLASVYSHLKNNPNDQVLYVFSDCTLPDCYKENVDESADDYIIALLINNNSPQTFELNQTLEDKNYTKGLIPPAVHFVNWLADKNEKELCLEVSSSNWVFNKCI